MEHDLSLKKEVDNKKQIPSKLVSEKPAERRQVTERAQTSLENSPNANTIKFKELSELKPRREFRHYDIIKNSSKVVVN